LKRRDDRYAIRFTYDPTIVALIKPSPPTPDPRLHHRSPLRASTEDLLMEVRRRIIRPRGRHHEMRDDWDGLDPRGDWLEEG